MTLDQQIKKAITNKAFDRCLGCVDKATKDIKGAITAIITARLNELMKKPNALDDDTIKVLNEILAEINK